jgi:hypothetical protein
VIHMPSKNRKKTLKLEDLREVYFLLIEAQFELPEDNRLQNELIRKAQKIWEVIQAHDLGSLTWLERPLHEFSKALRWFFYAKGDGPKNPFATDFMLHASYKIGRSMGKSHTATLNSLAERTGRTTKAIWDAVKRYKPLSKDREALKMLGFIADIIIEAKSPNDFLAKTEALLANPEAALRLIQSR